MRKVPIRPCFLGCAERLLGVWTAAAARRRCAIFATDVKLRAAADRIYYPDIIIACGKAANVDLIVEQPALIVEVTSPSTRAADRRETPEAYPKVRIGRRVVGLRRRGRGGVSPLTFAPVFARPPRRLEL